MRVDSNLPARSLACWFARIEGNFMHVVWNIEYHVSSVACWLGLVGSFELRETRRSNFGQIEGLTVLTVVR
jgi:hypothetical protein